MLCHLHRQLPLRRHSFPHRVFEPDAAAPHADCVVDGEDIRDPVVGDVCAIGAIRDVVAAPCPASLRRIAQHLHASHMTPPPHPDPCSTPRHPLFASLRPTSLLAPQATSPHVRSPHLPDIASHPYACHRGTPPELPQLTFTPCHLAPLLLASPHFISDPQHLPGACCRAGRQQKQRARRGKDPSTSRRRRSGLLSSHRGRRTSSRSRC